MRSLNVSYRALEPVRPGKAIVVIVVVLDGDAASHIPALNMGWVGFVLVVFHG